MKKNLFTALLLSFILLFGIAGCGEEEMATNDDDTNGMIDNDTNIATNEKKVVCTKESTNDDSDDVDEYILTFNDDKLTYIEINQSKDYKKSDGIEGLFEDAKNAANDIMEDIKESIAEATNNENNISTNIKIDVEKAGDTLDDQFSIDKDKTKEETVKDLEDKDYVCSD